MYTYLTHVPIVGSSHESRVVHLSALQELTVLDAISDSAVKTKVKVQVQPSCVALGPIYMACALNNTAWFYIIHDRDRTCRVYQFSYHVIAVRFHMG